ncbi:MAG: hypothetical protein ACRDU5_18915 [Mycobacterium sp.]
MIIEGRAIAERNDVVASEKWGRVLTEGHAPLVRARRVFRYLPSEPRCKVCNNPFGGLAGRVEPLEAFAHGPGSVHSPSSAPRL